MDMLGQNYKYSTKLKIYGKVSGGVLHGSAYIDPSQDPTISTEDLRSLLMFLKDKGIKEIDGKVDVVGIPGGGDRFSTSWLSEDWGQDWMPVPSDLVVDDNTARKDPARGYPLIPYGVGRDQNALISSLLTSSLGPSWICYHPGSKTMQFWHPSGPAVGGQIVGNPNEYNAAIANTLLKQMGIKVRGKEIPLSVMEETPEVLGEITTDPLSEIVKHCLKTSDNLYAQQLLRTLGALPSVSKDVEKATLEERGIARINAWLIGMGVAAGDVVLWDGCGLSRKNCFTPHSLNMVHRHMAGAHLKSAYLDAMPLTGEAGSTAGSWRYKTGSMDSVRTISGVLITGAGEPLALTIMVNAHSPSIRELRTSMSSLINHLLALPSLRLPNVPVKPIIIKPRGAAAKAAPRGKRSSSAASRRAPARSSGRRGHRR
jgi:D-alanyl-D-alanine carboxypeptidase/D-alanyl-D-alanine-endopeptidase (penicillin-binding protein 4)